MNENIKWFAAAVVVVGLAIGAVVYRDSWWTDKPPQSAPKPVSATTVAPPAAVPDEPAIQHPLPTPPAPEPLPSLDDSDTPLQSSLVELLGKEPVEHFIVPTRLVRNVVVSIDNLTTPDLPERVRPLHRTPGSFTVAGTEESPVLDPANYSRYNSLVQVIRSTDTAAVVDTYTRYYPLFQEAYAGLGHPPQYFNDRLIQVIDHLLETPDPKGPIALVQPNVQYEFADQDLESLSSGQKALIRMGSDNAKTVKDKLRELRAALAAQAPAN
jgi:hypothetical protein